jgi:hypothetical protein
MAAKRSQPLRGATEPRLHSPYLKGKSKVDDVIELANLIVMDSLDYFLDLINEEERSVDEDDEEFDDD